MNYLILDMVTFNELGFYGNGVVMREKLFVIPKRLRNNVLQAAHQGYPGLDAMLTAQSAETVGLVAMDG